MPRHNMISLGHCPVHHEHIIHILMQLREFFGEKKNGETSAMKQILVGDGGTEGTGLKVK